MGAEITRSRQSSGLGLSTDYLVGNPSISTRVKVASLAEIDAMVGAHITNEVPKTHWEDLHAHLRCETFEEALEAMGDPYFQQGMPSERGAHPLLREVHVYREYSTKLDVAWEVVERLTDANVALAVKQENGGWSASFGSHPAAAAVTAPLAICLAGLRVCGVEVELTARPALG